ncbi:MAG TPA: MarC family protein [Alphaproteobacteria bacterium]|nr:MarC family protein [Alphaproteobacteria bacterium]
MWALIVHAGVTFLVVIDPVGTAPIFASLTAGRSPEERGTSALTGIVVAAAVLYIFAFIGEAFLTALGVTLAAFRIAGGVLLFLVAIDMVLARQSGLRSTTSSEDEEAHHRHDIAVFPLAVPLIAGPGAIASVMLLTEEAKGSWLGHGIVLGVLSAILLITYLCLLAAGRIVNLLGVTGTNVVGRVLGIVLAALATQFIIDGVQATLTGSG